MDDLDDLDRKISRTILGGEMVLDNFVKLGQTKVRQNIVVNNICTSTLKWTAVTGPGRIPTLLIHPLKQYEWLTLRLEADPSSLPDVRRKWRQACD
jgi:hypothetical protein